MNQCFVKMHLLIIGRDKKHFAGVRCRHVSYTQYNNASHGSVALKAANKDIEIIATEEISDVKVYHNFKWTREVFENILENAIKYSPCKSIIKISIEQLETYTKISIEDSGIGIRDEEYVKIFQRFYRSKDVENAEGSGIGLYLCRLILENEKGSITVKSQYGKGSVFSVFLLNSIPQQQK